jgi:hypothetical protein
MLYLYLTPHPNPLPEGEGELGQHASQERVKVVQAKVAYLGCL